MSARGVAFMIRPSSGRITSGSYANAGATSPSSFSLCNSPGRFGKGDIETVTMPPWLVISTSVRAGTAFPSAITGSNTHCFTTSATAGYHSLLPRISSASSTVPSALIQTSNSMPAVFPSRGAGGFGALTSFGGVVALPGTPARNTVDGRHAAASRDTRRRRQGYFERFIAAGLFWGAGAPRTRCLQSLEPIPPRAQAAASPQRSHTPAIAPPQNSHRPPRTKQPCSR